MGEVCAWVVSLSTVVVVVFALLVVMIKWASGARFGLSPTL